MRHEGRIVSANWAARQGAYPIPYLDYEFPIQHDEVYLFDSVTESDLRGQNIAPALSVWVLRRLRAEGIRQTVIAVIPENRASLRARAKSGYRVCGMLRLVRIGRWQRLFHRSDLGRNPA